MRKDKLVKGVDFVDKPLKYMEFTITMGKEQQYHTRYENNEDWTPSHEDTVWVVTKGKKQICRFIAYSTSYIAPRGLPYTLQELKRNLKYLWSRWGEKRKLRLKAIKLKKELQLINKKLQAMKTDEQGNIREKK